MDSSFKELFEKARAFYDEGSHIRALLLINQMSFAKGEDKDDVDNLEGKIFRDLGKHNSKSDEHQEEEDIEEVEDIGNTDLKFLYLLGSVECFSRIVRFPPYSAAALFTLAEEFGSLLYYKKSLRKARKSLAFLDLLDSPDLLETRKEMERIIKIAESEIANPVSKAPPVGSPVAEQILTGEIEKLRPFWAGLSADYKRNFMKVRLTKLEAWVEKVSGGSDALEQVLAYVKKQKKWIFWVCRSCSKRFSTVEHCKHHLEEVHSAGYEPSSRNVMPRMLDESWAHKISVGSWKPVNAIGAVNKINNKEFIASHVNKEKEGKPMDADAVNKEKEEKPVDVNKEKEEIPVDADAVNKEKEEKPVDVNKEKEEKPVIAYRNGWCSDWPLAEDEERSELLQQIKSLLVSFYKHKLLTASIRDCVMHLVFKYFESLEVSTRNLTDYHLLKTPQSICFLGRDELHQILAFLRKISCTRDDGTDLVCRAVNSSCSGNGVKGRLDFDSQFSFLLLDKRLLQDGVDHVDKEGKVRCLDPKVHYANVHPRGDGMITWLHDHFSGDENRWEFPCPISEHNLDVWVAVLRAVQFTCRTLRTKDAKKSQFLSYDAALTHVREVCKSGRNLEKDQKTSYASHVCDRCGDNETRKFYLCAVLDVLRGGESCPTKFDFPRSEDFVDLKTASKETVLKSTDALQSMVNEKVALIDSKLLLIEKSRIRLLEELMRLAFLDYRSYINQPLKTFLSRTLTREFDRVAHR